MYVITRGHYYSRINIADFDVPRQQKSARRIFVWLEILILFEIQNLKDPLKVDDFRLKNANKKWALKELRPIAYKCFFREIDRLF